MILKIISAIIGLAAVAFLSGNLEKPNCADRELCWPFPNVLEKVSAELGNKKDLFRISMDSPVDNPESSMASFNRQFQLNKVEQESVAWGWCHDIGNTMFHVIQAYTKGAQMKDLSAESSYKLQRTGGNILAMVN